jgi:hypothetical protein
VKAYPLHRSQDILLIRNLMIFTGDCVKIPQLLPDATIPKLACVKMYSTAVKEGILW